MSFFSNLSTFFKFFQSGKVRSSVVLVANILNKANVVLEYLRIELSSVTGGERFDSIFDKVAAGITYANKAIKMITDFLKIDTTQVSAFSASGIEDALAGLESDTDELRKTLS